MVTLQDIAERAGVSKTTVSLVLNDKPGVSEEKREEIRRIAQVCGYHLPHRIPDKQRTIRFLKYQAKGYMVCQNGDFITRVIDGVESTAREHGYSLTMMNVQAENLEAMIPVINEAHDDGIIFLGTELEPEMAPLLQGLSAPLVVIDNEMRHLDQDTVVMDNEEAVYRAMQYLCNKGHRQIGHLTTTYAVPNLWARSRAFRQVLLEFGLPDEAAFSYCVPDDVRSYAYALVRQIDPEHLPTAILADNDILAINLLRALEKLGKRVPEDISVIGIDDLAISAMTRPELTTIHLEKKRMGGAAVERLLSLIADRSQHPLKIMTSCWLVERHSVQAI
nr:substrate-binding domain-containing protein [Mitsuokella multacida]